MKILSVDSSDKREKYNEYILSSPSTTVTDLVEWGEVVNQTYNHKMYYLMAVEEERVVGVIALFLIEHIFFERLLITAPFGNDGGFYFHNEQVKNLLIEEAINLADKLDVKYLLIRTRENIFTQTEKFYVDDSYSTFCLNLDTSLDDIWNRIDGTKRNQIKKSKRYDLTVKIGKEHLGLFFDIMHTHMRELGSPFHKYNFYTNIITKLGDYTEIMILEYQNRPIGVALLFNFKGCLMNLNTSSLKSYNTLCPNDFLYWEMIEYGHKINCKIFDMGRSKIDSGNYNFKKQWGTIPKRLYYNYYLRGLNGVPDMHPSNLKFKLAIGVWKRLPLFLTKRIGPYLIKGIP